MWGNIQKYYSPIIDVLTFGIMIVMIAYVIIHFGKLPDEIPTHFTLSGEADGWSSKGILIGLIVINFHALVLCFVINYFLVVKSENTKDSLQLINIPFVKKEQLTEEQIYLVKQNMAKMLATLNLCLSLLFASIYHAMIQNGLGNQMGLGSSFNVLLILVFIPIFYYSWKAYHVAKTSHS